ncbi:hypothetical protein [Pseudomonas anguilliseptica]|uniref:hypothetical protein n=1 Tax=Pseudomonas anguilliseptica TaxID=53406 RepID=UPI003736305B
MREAKLLSAAVMLSVLVMPHLALAQSPKMQTTGPCSSIVSGAGASGTSYCIGITDEALKRLTNITAATQGRRIFVTEAWLSPTPMFGRPSADKQSLNEQVFLSVRATNITAVPIVLTAAKLEIVQARNLSKAGGSFGASNILWPALSANKPIIIEIGEQVDIKFGEGVELNGMASRLRKNRDLDSAHTLPAEPTRINGDRYINWFAEQMRLLYGPRAQLKLTLYEGDYKPIATLSLPLAQGVDFFYRGEAVDQKGNVQYAPRLAYDAFLGQYLEMRALMEPGFRINTPQTRVIEVTPDPTVWGKQRYRDLGVQEPPE